MGAVWEGRVDFAQKPQPLGRPSPGAPRSRAPGGAGFAARTSGSLAYFCASPRCWLSSILKTSLETVLGSPKTRDLRWGPSPRSRRLGKAPSPARCAAGGGAETTGPDKPPRPDTEHSWKQ